MRQDQRLRQGREFAAVYRRGKPYRSDLLVLRAVRNQRPLSRFGLTTARALGNAVKRNRVRRRLREAIRSLPVVEGWDVVLNARRGSAEADYWTLRTQVMKLMERAGLLEEGASPT